MRSVWTGSSTNKDVLVRLGLRKWYMEVMAALHKDDLGRCYEVATFCACVIIELHNSPVNPHGRVSRNVVCRACTLPAPQD